eukprot:2477919-Rhodomonas_salina.1
MSGTDLAYAATRQSGHDYHHLCCYGLYHCFHPGSTLRAPYAMSGTDIAYGAICLRAPYAYAMSSTVLRDVRYLHSVCSYQGKITEGHFDVSIGLNGILGELYGRCVVPDCDLYAMPGTDIAHGAICPRDPHGAMGLYRHSVCGAIGLRACWAMS